jgi:hypothetical protein
MQPPTDKQVQGNHSHQEERKEIKPWSLEEKQLFYEGLNKHYKKFNLISQMVYLLKYICDRIDSKSVCYTSSSVLLS